MNEITLMTVLIWVVAIIVGIFIFLCIFSLIQYIVQWFLGLTAIDKNIHIISMQIEDVSGQIAELGRECEEYSDKIKASLEQMEYNLTADKFE